jgi:hypothetical protein
MLAYYGDYGTVYYLYLLICKEEQHKIEEEMLRRERKEKEEKRVRRERKYPVIGSLINKISRLREESRVITV